MNLIPPEVGNPTKMPKFKAEDIPHILSCTGRKVKKMLPDGNCLFRSLSFCLHRSQDRHLEIRKILVQFIERNGNNYKHLLFRRTLSEHLECMKKPFVWGTQLEVQAAAHYYVSLFSHQKTSARELPLALIHTQEQCCTYS